MEGLLKEIAQRKRLSLTLRLFSHGTVIFGVCAYIYLGIIALGVSYASAARLVVISAIPFLLVSVARRLINAPRPYELYDFCDTPPKQRKGESFPSRHVFSAFLIGTLALFHSVWLGALLLLCGLILSAARILLGIHFPRDCIAGAAVGIASAVIGVLIANPFI